MRRSARPTVAIEITPLREKEWTGIPMFTQRLIAALLGSKRVTVTFHRDGVRIPDEVVMRALERRSGSELVAALNARGTQAFTLVDPGSYFLWPSVKKSGGIFRNEASVIHDLSTLLQPEFHLPGNINHHLRHLATELATNNRTFCISDATRTAVEQAFPSVGDTTRTLYQYVDWPDEFADMDRNLPPLQLAPYALVIGTIEPRKNLGILFSSLSEPQIEASDLRFVVIGKEGWLVRETLAKLDAGRRDRITLAGYMSEFVKYRLIKNCEFLIFPSVYEGFGIPALEALSLGKQVLASRSSSLPEVVGSAGVLFDPFSSTEFAAGCQELERRGKSPASQETALAQASLFTRELMAQPILDWVFGE